MFQCYIWSLDVNTEFVPAQGRNTVLLPVVIEMNLAITIQASDSLYFCLADKVKRLVWRKYGKG